MRRLAFVSGWAATLLVALQANAQEKEDFYAFDPTVRQQAAIQAGIVNAQTYGAVGAMNRVLMPNGVFDRSRRLHEMVESGASNVISIG